MAASALHAFAAEPEKTPSPVSVTFVEPDKFTDASSSFAGETDEYYLKLLKETLQTTAERRLAAGQKLEISVSDVDLAGDFLPGQATSAHDIRIVKDIYMPRVKLSFKLLGADGNVLKEGDRTLSDMNFMNNISIIGRNDPLFYDKALLKDWVEKEFKS